MDTRRIMGITMGDPYGIGPEIIIKTINEEEKTDDILVVGDYDTMQRARDLTRSGKGVYPIRCLDELEPERPDVPVLEAFRVSHKIDVQGEKGPTAKGGEASISFIRRAAEMALDKKIAAVITAPISKEAIHMAGYRYAGHTEFLAEMTGAESFAMMLVGGPLRVILVTTHCALSMVSKIIDKERIYNILRLAHDWWIEHLGYSPKLAVAALNPHGGEGGIFGEEEGLHIRPAVEQARGEGIDVRGPYPSDTLFYYAKDGRYDAVVVMYHDQGLIPLKMLSFGNGVNCTIGLPIIRTSVDHGTAYDIAWKGKADPSSLKAALRMARDLSSKSFV
ncbi:4-hydroxythreonine-4-phosphate dehydrogenase PdxA [bacterium]|nr:4-hydroxythreonine-4-phosphate dehydrogenase PdxA [bacterium]